MIISCYPHKIKKDVLQYVELVGMLLCHCKNFAAVSWILLWTFRLSLYSHGKWKPPNMFFCEKDDYALWELMITRIYSETQIRCLPPSKLVSTELASIYLPKKWRVVIPPSRFWYLLPFKLTVWTVKVMHLFQKGRHYEQKMEIGLQNAEQVFP